MRHRSAEDRAEVDRGAITLVPPSRAAQTETPRELGQQSTGILDLRGREVGEILGPRHSGGAVGTHSSFRRLGGVGGQVLDLDVRDDARHRPEDDARAFTKREERQLGRRAGVIAEEQREGRIEAVDVLVTVHEQRAAAWRARRHAGGRQPSRSRAPHRAAGCDAQGGRRVAAAGRTAGGWPRAGAKPCGCSRLAWSARSSARANSMRVRSPRTASMILLILEQHAKRLVDGVGIERRVVERDERGGPIEGLRDAGGLVQARPCAVPGRMPSPARPAAPAHRAAWRPRCAVPSRNRDSRSRRTRTGV